MIPLTLTIEQEFNLKLYEEEVKNLSDDELQQSLLEIMKQLMIKDNLIRHFIKNGAI